MTFAVKLALPLIAVGLLVGAGTASGQMMEMDMFAKLHSGIAAVDLCRGGLSAGEHAAAARAVDAIIGGKMGGGLRLTTLVKAKDDVDILWSRKGCYSDEMKAHVATYDDEIKPRM